MIQEKTDLSDLKPILMNLEVKASEVGDEYQTIRLGDICGHNVPNINFWNFVYSPVHNQPNHYNNR